MDTCRNSSAPLAFSLLHAHASLFKKLCVCVQPFINFMGDFHDLIATNMTHVVVTTAIQPCTC